MLVFRSERVYSFIDMAENSSEEVSKNCDAIIDALNRTIEIFTSHSEKAFEEVVSNGLQQVARAASLDRIAVYRLFDKISGRMGQIYVWAYGDTAALDQELIELPKIPPVIYWLDILTTGECVHSNIYNMTRDQAEFCALYGIKSILFVPVFTHGNFWGVITLEDHTNVRYFNDECLEMLRSSAYLCANAFIWNELAQSADKAMEALKRSEQISKTPNDLQAEMEREIADANELNKVMLEIMPVGLTVIDDSLRIIDCNDVILNILETTKDYYLNHVEEFLPGYQIDGTISSTMMVDAYKQALTGEKYVLECEYCASSGELIPFEVTLMRAKYKGKYIVLAYQYDLRNAKEKMQNILREQDDLLKIKLEQQELISEISRGFISSGDSESYIKEAIVKLGRYHKVSRVFIFSIDYNAQQLYSKYDWTADGLSSDIAELNMFAFLKSRFPERFPDGISLPVLFCEDTAENHAEPYCTLLSVGVRAFILAPLYIEGNLWGFLCEEQKSPRCWTANERAFVAITAGTIAGVIMRGIYNKKLKDTLNKATVANRAKGDFLSNMSHEIRTPLNAIIGMTIIGKNAEDKERKNYALNRIEDASMHLLGVINDILDMSKIDANKLDLSFIEFDFERMFQRVMNIVCFRVEEKQQTFKVYIDRKIPNILVGDDQRLMQVITNLVVNAVKFTPENGAIRIGTYFLGKQNDICSIKITVTDTGIGISDEQQKRLFQPFQQAENNISRKFGGTGLGLSISKKIVELMGGNIWIESELGKGATFSFTVKLKCAKEKESGSHACFTDLNKVRILVVDDDQDTLTFFKVMMRELNASCDTAGSAEEALDIVERSGTYDIYFIDWELPGINGIELAGILKGKEGDPNNVFVVLISAASWGPIGDNVKKTEIDKFLSKPLLPSTIKDAISSCLNADDEHAKESLLHSVPIFADHCMLLAEDVEVNREIIIALLEPTQLKIDCAENGAIAVQMFRDAPSKYDIVFMDLQMPEVDGLVATQNIRSMDIPKAKTIPIIAITANVLQEDIDKCLSAGMNDHVGKPLDYEKILNILRYYLLDSKNDQAMK